MRYPVSFAQRRVWLRETLAPGGPASHLRYAAWLDGQVELGVLQRALDAVVARHAALRTSIVAGGDEPEQVVADRVSVPIDHVVLPDGPDAAARAEVVAAGLAEQPFDLARGPLLRAALIGARPDRSLFVLVAHQIIADEASLAMLLTELSTVYQKDSEALPPLWMDYGDYAVWQRDRLRGEELSRQLDYWRERLRDVPPGLTLPSDRPRPVTRSVQAVTATAALDAAAAGRLRAIAHEAGTTPAIAILTGYAVALSRYARQADLLIGVPVRGRIRVELEPIAGRFADTVAVRLCLAATVPFTEVLGQVRDAVAEAETHGELPLDKLAEELGVEPAVRFVPAASAAPALELPGVAARTLEPATGIAESDLDLSTSDDGTLTLRCRSDLFDEAFAGRFLRSVLTVLEHAAAAPDTPVAGLPLLTPAERAALTTGRPAPQAPSDVRRLLAASAATAMPGVCERAARLARVLADHGAGPETRVGVCLGRDAGLLTALLGVWWAGAAFVLLEPELPLARLEIMARDAGLRIVLSDGAHAGLAGSVGGGVTVIMADEPAAEPLDPVPVPPEALACTVFTSGPAGPVGVDIEHRAVLAVLAATRDLGVALVDGFPADLLLPLVSGADLGHVRRYVLDERLTPVPVGVVGEVYVAGPGLARGYLGRPGHTAAEFLPDPWGTEPGARMYATGDLGRWRENGDLEPAGSAGRRFTVRGVRVDRGEVETVLRAHPAVRDVAVTGMPRAGETALVAYVVPDPDSPAARPETDLLALFRAHLRAALPDQLIPALIVGLPALPLRPDGTVDRTALPAPGWAAPPAADRVPPRDPVEAAMARIWAELLRTGEPIGVHDNLFGFGGGSLTAIRFAARIADTYGVNLPMHRIFATPTIADLAALVSAELPPPSTGTDREAELATLSDDELDDLLRAALAARDRRRTARGDPS
ncbi:condensation domain-containing protein [Actinophytocola sp.]|uniref:condensation domain-containing protein n=1 Tax=Actinophytocola sp. TaxID=1872138 RepID=UPI002D809C8D|nr:condensation domain-containing protein [Actinophytocola sp.]HET9143145.1 condensation domain-containing protein [Actinophytocola sp.]